MADATMSPNEFNERICRALGVDEQHVGAIEIRLVGGQMPVAVITKLLYNNSAAAVVAEFVRQEFRLEMTNPDVGSFRISGDGTRSADW